MSTKVINKAINRKRCLLKKDRFGVLDRSIANRIVSCLRRQKNIHQIILFGSYARGNPKIDSDIDLCIITNETELTKSFSKKLQRKVQIAKALIDIKKEFPIDLLVYTKAEWQKLLKLDHFFIQEINETGIPLL